MNKKGLLEKLKFEGFSEDILGAFEKIPREEFVLPAYKEKAYEDIALPIGKGQTISQPYTVAFMLSKLELDTKKKMKILEVGSGSGYALALLSVLNPFGENIGVERISELVKNSKKSFLKLRKKNLCKNVKVIYDDGSHGIKGKIGEEYDRILASASFDEIPEDLISKLKVGGIFVGPVGQSILKIEIKEDGRKITTYPGFLFVPILEGKI